MDLELWLLCTSDSPSTWSTNATKQIDLDDDHPLLRSLTDALTLCEVWPEPHLNSHELEILEELIECLHFNSYWSIMALPDLAYPDLAQDKFSGTDPDQDAEAFIRLIECKINFALGTEPDEAEDAYVIYLPIQKESSIFLIAKRTSSWMVWEYYPRCNDLEWWPNSVHNQIFSWEKQIETQNGSWTLYTSTRRADSKFPSPNKENSRQRLARRYGWSWSSWTGRWTHRTSSPEKTKIHRLHIKGT